MIFRSFAFSCKEPKNSFFTKVKNNLQKKLSPGILGWRNAKTRNSQKYENTRFHVFSNIFLEGFCSNTQKNKT